MVAVSVATTIQFVVFPPKISSFFVFESPIFYLFSLSLSHTNKQTTKIQFTKNRNWPQNKQTDESEISSVAAEAASKIDDLIRQTHSTPKKSPTTSITSIGSDLDQLKSPLKQKQLKYNIGGSPCNDNEDEDIEEDIDSIIGVAIVSIR